MSLEFAWINLGMCVEKFAMMMIAKAREMLGRN
jgi:hypothetical protein